MMISREKQITTCIVIIYVITIMFFSYLCIRMKYSLNPIDEELYYSNNESLLGSGKNKQ